MTRKPDFLGRAIRTGTARSQEQRFVATMISAAKDAVVDVDGIRPRLNAPTRALSPDHVLALASSIAELGLIEPIAVDQEMRLVAGAHRLAAMRLLSVPSESRRETWMRLFPGTLPGKEFAPVDSAETILMSIPVHVLGFNSEVDPATALLVEIAENDKRRNYSHEEVRGFADRLQDAGYRFTEGRPKQGERALIPVLAATLGISTRTVKRALAPQAEPKTVTPVTVFATDEDAMLAGALRRWMRSGEHSARRLAVELLHALGGKTDALKPVANDHDSMTYQ